MALCARLDKLDYRTYVLLGDGECAEGSVWEAASLAGYHQLNNLIAVVDVNRLGQSQATALGHDLTAYKKRFEAFGWRTEEIEGHDLEEIVEVLAAVGLGSQPLVILARTLKGGGVSFLQDKEGWHGKALSKDEAARAVAELQPSARSGLNQPIPAPTQLPEPNNQPPSNYPPCSSSWRYGGHSRGLWQRPGSYWPAGPANYRPRRGYEELHLLGQVHEKCPERFTECFIAEQNMVGVATGFGTRGKVPFASTFATFFTRAFDQVRVVGISMANLKLVGSHVGVSIGEDGPSQMGLEDIAMMRAVAGSIVLYPSDAVMTEKLVEYMAQNRGIQFLRTSRPKTPVIYGPQEAFPIGSAKVLRQSSGDRVTVVGAGVTLFESLKAADQLKSEGIGITVIDAYSIKPLGRDVILEAARRTNNVVPQLKIITPKVVSAMPLREN
jgi:transketolase